MVVEPAAPAMGWGARDTSRDGVRVRLERGPQVVQLVLHAVGAGGERAGALTDAHGLAGGGVQSDRTVRLAVRFQRAVVCRTGYGAPPRFGVE